MTLDRSAATWICRDVDGFETEPLTSKGVANAREREWIDDASLVRSVSESGARRDDLLVLQTLVTPSDDSGRVEPIPWVRDDSGSVVRFRPRTKGGWAPLAAYLALDLDASASKRRTSNQRDNRLAVAVIVVAGLILFGVMKFRGSARATDEADHETIESVSTRFDDNDASPLRRVDELETSPTSSAETPPLREREMRPVRDSPSALPDEDRVDRVMRREYRQLASELSGDVELLIDRFRQGKPVGEIADDYEGFTRGFETPELKHAARLAAKAWGRIPGRLPTWQGNTLESALVSIILNLGVDKVLESWSAWLQKIQEECWGRMTKVAERLYRDRPSRQTRRRRCRNGQDLGGSTTFWDSSRKQGWADADERHDRSASRAFQPRAGRRALLLRLLAVWSFSRRVDESMSHPRGGRS